jgi:hypothetical protein
LVDLLPQEDSVLPSDSFKFLVDERNPGTLSDEDWREVRKGKDAIAGGELTTLDL